MMLDNPKYASVTSVSVLRIFELCNDVIVIVHRKIESLSAMAILEPIFAENDEVSSPSSCYFPTMYYTSFKLDFHGLHPYTILKRFVILDLKPPNQPYFPMIFSDELEQPLRSQKIQERYTEMSRFVVVVL